MSGGLFGSSSAKPLFGGTSSSGLFGAGAPAPHAHGVEGLVGNFAKDVGSAVMGLPFGLVQTAEHPIRSVENMGKATWQTWSPLFHGHIGQFAHQTYDHPLAPLLDVASALSLGVGGAAKLGALTDAADGSLLGKAAKLTEPKSITLEHPNPAEARLHPMHTLTKDLSTQPGRRALQEAVIRMEPHLPQWAGGALKTARYNSAAAREMGGRLAAKNLLAHDALAKSAQITQLMSAGKILSGDHAAAARQGILSNIFLNLSRKAPMHLTDAQFAAFKKTPQASHYGLLANPAYLGDNAKLAGHLDRQLARHDRTITSLVQQHHDITAQIKQLKQDRLKMATPPEWAKVDAKIGKLQEKAREIKGGSIQALEKRQAVRAQQLAFHSRSFRQKFEHMASSEATFQQSINDLGKHFTVGHDVTKAARTADGKLTLVPKHDAKLLGWEAKASSKAVKWMWRNPNRLWKMIDVGYTPRVLTDNAVGNWMLYALREGNPVVAAAAVHDAIRLTHGKEAAAKAVSTPFHRDNWLYRHFSDELGNTFGNTLGNEPGKVLDLSRAQKGLYGLVHTIADQPVRASAIVSYMKRDPMVKAQWDKLKTAGVDNAKAFDRAVTYSLRKDPTLQSRAAMHARRTSGDYFTVRPGVERVLHGLVPFYMWDRHILRSSGNMLLDNPTRAVALQHISNEGTDKLHQMVGTLPDFMQSLIPFHVGGGRVQGLSTTNLNPFSTLGDLAQVAQGITTGGGQSGLTALSQTSPFISGAYEAATGKSILTGAPMATHGGLIPSVVFNIAQNLPAAKVIEGLVNQPTEVTPKGNDLLYAHDRLSPLSSIFGVPIKNASIPRANELAAQIETGKKPHKSKALFG